jgi:hypothetical protein
LAMIGGKRRGYSGSKLSFTAVFYPI